eukprot:2554951-Rhodomonas_salina.2
MSALAPGTAIQACEWTTWDQSITLWGVRGSPGLTWMTSTSSKNTSRLSESPPRSRIIVTSPSWSVSTPVTNGEVSTIESQPVRRGGLSDSVPIMMRGLTS